MHVRDVTEVNTAGIKVHVASEINTSVIIIILHSMTLKQMVIATQLPLLEKYASYWKILVFDYGANLSGGLLVC